jgi:predicted site-specific integrase-resolvase
MTYVKEPSKDPKYDRTLLRGMKEIAAYLGIAVSTLYRWNRNHALPMGKLPNGEWCSSTALIDRWIQCRDPYKAAYRESVQ